MKRLASLGLLLPLVGFAIWPIALLVGRGVLALGGEVSAVLAAEPVRRALVGTIVTSSGAALIALVLGLPLAVVLERTDLPLRRALRAAFVLPSAIPPFIQCMGWIALANPKAGWLNQLFGTGRVDIYGTAGISFVLGIAALPLVLLSASAALQRIDSSLEEAARVCGASPLRTLVAVPGRLALPAALSGTALAFLFAASAFGVPYLLGIAATPPSLTLTTRIYTEVLMGPRGLATAAVLSTLLLALASVVLVASRLITRGAPPLLSGKGIKIRPLPLGAARMPAAAVCVVLAFALVGLPLLAVFLTSLTTAGRLEQLSFAHWSTVLGNARTVEAALRSLWLAAVAAALVTLCGLLLGLARRTGTPGRLAEALASWPYAVPGTVLALGLIVAFSRDLRFIAVDRVAFVLALGNTVWLLLVAWVVKHLAFGVRNASDGLSQLDPSLTEAARVNGAAPFRAFLDGTLPQLRAPLAAAFTLTFLTCVTELTLSVLLVPTGKDVLGTLLFELQSYADPSSAAVVACAFVLLVVAVLSLQSLLQRREVQR